MFNNNDISFYEAELERINSFPASNFDEKVNFSDEQTAFIEADLKQDIVLCAAAGSGKTSCIIERIKFLRKNGVAGDEILCLSFTRSAAKEILHRKAICESRTIHSCCLTILVNNHIKIVNKDFIIKGTFDRNEENICGELVAMAIKWSSSLIEKRQKPLIENLPKYLKKVFDFMIENKCCCMEFAPIFYTVMRAEGKIANKKEYAFIFIDEAQDINATSYLAISYIMLHNDAKKIANIAFIGDFRQAIFSFAGGDSRFMFERKKHKNCLNLELTKTFRMPEKISEAINDEYFFDTKFGKTGGKYDQSCSKAAAIKKVKKYLRQGKTVGVIGATKFEVEKNKEWLRLYDVPFNQEKELAQTAGFKIFKEIVETIRKKERFELSYFNIQRNDAVFRFIAAFPEMRELDSFIWLYLDKNKIPAALKRVEKHLDIFFFNRNATIYDVKNEKFIDDEANKADVITAHKAKGREFDLVIWSDFESNFYDQNIEERRNLIYVVCTRAKNELILISKKGKNG